MKNSKTVYDMTAADLEEHLLGKTVTAVAGDTITLSDGTALRFEDTADCCAYFNAELRAGNFTDNAITAVNQIDTGENEYDEKWSLHILAADKRVATVDIEGTSSSGYYCHSVNLIVTRPEDGPR